MLIIPPEVLGPSRGADPGSAIMFRQRSNYKTVSAYDERVTDGIRYLAVKSPCRAGRLSLVGLMKNYTRLREPESVGRSRRQLCLSYDLTYLSSELVPQFVSVGLAPLG